LSYTEASNVIPSRCIKGLCRIGQSQAHPAGRDQGARVVCIRKAFGDGQTALDIPKHTPDPDIRGWPQQGHAAISSTLGVEICHLAQLVRHLSQMVSRNIAARGDFGSAHKAIHIGSDNTSRTVLRYWSVW